MFRFFNALYFIFFAIAFFSCNSDHTGAKDHFNKGIDLLFKEDNTAAKKEFEAAVTADTSYWQAYFELGSVSLMQGDLQNAMFYYKRTISINPKFATAYYSLSNVENLMGDERASAKENNREFEN